jgi:N6-L-threonylcarbamoyladenine synthase
MVILSIESSCDETACAIVKDGLFELSSTIATSKELHEKTGGVVPEIAARKQLESIIPVIQDCLDKINYTEQDIDAIAVTVGPGLIGSLIIGIEAAKSLSLAWNKPLIPVNHLMGHVYSSLLGLSDDIKHTIEVSLNFDNIFPAIGFVVSGGHTDLTLMKSHQDIIYIGGTLDDAAGEAFDKTARLIGLSKYLGGVELSKLAATCEHNELLGRLPRPLMDQPNYDFSFSGLKTAVRYLVEREHPDPKIVSCEFENAVCDVLVSKCIKAAKDNNVKSILLGGGVSANTQLRTRLKFEVDALGINLYLPPLRLTGDNAVYIASAGYFSINGDLNNLKQLTLEEIVPQPSLGIV